VPQELPEEIQTALFDLQRYLLDEIPPITAWDSIATLMEQPPALLMRQVHAWTVEQGQKQAAPMADFLFHALKKVFMVGELKLIDRGAVLEYLDRVEPLALQLCPAEDRDLLKSNLAAMRVSRNVSASKVDIAPRAEQAKPSAPLDADAARTAKRFTLIIDRLARAIGGAPATPQTVGQLVTLATSNSRNEEELADYMQRVKPIAGDAVRDANLFKLLGDSLPAWDIVAPLHAAPQINAMKKIVSMAGDPIAGAKRLRELLTAAIDQFNGGNLSAAISMLELAEVTIVEKKIDATSVERIRAEAVDAMRPDQLKKYTENKAKHVLLRKALSFFPALTKEGLFAELRGEARPERRRSILGLLEAYGNDGRGTALAELDAELQRKPEEVDTYYLRNLIYLLHRVARESDDGMDKEIDALGRASARGQNIYVIKEAATALGQIKTDGCVKLLTMRLAEIEATLLRSDTSMYPMDEMQKVLDRIAGALGRIGTPAALKTLARHGMKANVLLGDTRARLATLSQHDLAFDEETMNLLIKAVREDLPSGLLGRLILKKQPSTIRAMEALSGTRSEAVDELFREIAGKYCDQEIGKAAAKFLAAAESARVAPQVAAAASLSGELEFFGLPSVMQSLAEMRATGLLTVSTKQGEIAGKLVFGEGKFLNAMTGQLKGVDAVYQLLERPVTGAFAFVPYPPERVKSTIPPSEVMPLLMEGIRRHDEFNQACTIAPDDAVLKPTGSKPAPHEDERDAALIREVWVKAQSGVPVGSWESQIPADAYRVRRLVAHWMEQGALQAN
jgi:hypothetical protein